MLKRLVESFNLMNRILKAIFFDSLGLFVIRFDEIGLLIKDEVSCNFPKVLVIESKKHS